jgi:dTDP-4-amino-4,6-dideoxygalactose transaminase
MGAPETLAVRTIGSLGVFGGRPSFPAPLHVGQPNLPPFERLAVRLQRVFERKWLTNRGPEVLEFEREVARVAEVEHCVAVCNATVGLEIAIRALGMTGEVIVPSFTFAATAHALTWLGLTPVFCDLDPASHAIDPSAIEALITPRTSGILAVHLWGSACDVEALEAVARRRNLRLLFDAAHAFGCSHKGRAVGRFGDAEVFSFHATKFLNTFEGGAVVTNDEALALAVRRMTNFGFAGVDHGVAVGTNGKMSEASAAMGLASLEMMDEVVAWNRRNYHQYLEELRGMRGIRTIPYDSAERSNFQYIVLEIHAGESGVERDVLLEVLHGENVFARRYFYPGVHRMEPYRTSDPNTGSRLPQTEALVKRVLVLPTGKAIGEQEISTICELIRYCLANGREISGRLPPEKRVIARELR